MRILAPVDQSRRDGIVLPYCVQLAQALGAVVSVLHVVPLTRSLVPRVMREAEAYAEAVVSGLREQGVDAEGFVRRGGPSTVIVQMAGELPADLIIMVTRGRSGIGKLIVGSVADAVLANCPKPVLLLSEVSNGVKVNEKVQMQSAYVATVIWQRQMKGLCTEEEAQAELERLAGEGLDRGVLFGTYEGHRERGYNSLWMDISFQLETLRQFFPEALASEIAEAAREAGAANDAIASLPERWRDERVA